MKTAPFDQPQSLMLETLAMLKERKLLDVHVETRISFYWLRSFAARAIKNPSVNRVQYLHAYLTSSKV